MGDSSRGSSGFFSLAARGISRFMSAGTSEVSPATRNTLGAARAPGSTRDAGSDPLGLAQLYTEKPEPTSYTTDAEGNYPIPKTQTDPTVRNSNIPLVAEVALLPVDTLAPPFSLYNSNTAPSISVVLELKSTFFAFILALSF